MNFVGSKAMTLLACLFGIYYDEILFDGNYMFNWKAYIDIFIDYYGYASIIIILIYYKFIIKPIKSTAFFVCEFTAQTTKKLKTIKMEKNRFSIVISSWFLGAHS